MVCQQSLNAVLETLTPIALFACDACGGVQDQTAKCVKTYLKEHLWQPSPLIRCSGPPAADLLRNRNNPKSTHCLPNPLRTHLADHMSPRKFCVSWWRPPLWCSYCTREGYGLVVKRTKMKTWAGWCMTPGTSWHGLGKIPTS